MELMQCRLGDPGFLLTALCKVRDVSYLQQMLLDKFIRLVDSDPDLQGSCEHLPADTMTITEGKCVFTIAALFNWVKADCDMDYLQFRTALYNSTLNNELRQLGYILEVNRTTGNVDTSTYQLVKR
jgi:hypothetical protein